MDHYTYQALNRSTDEICLAHFLFVDGNTTRLHIETYSLSKAPPFTALSYEWGQTETSEIIVDNRAFLIRRNLAQGLCALWNCWRREDVETQGLFWADALCVDQSNTTERGHQVNLMGSIYLSVETVVVWLGPAVGDSNRAIQA